MTRATDMSRRIAVEFARELHRNPKQAQNWSALEAHDDLPEFDYITLYAEFGEVTREMERAYKSAFNDTFIGATA
jgi:hypothetical protein